MSLGLTPAELASIDQPTATAAALPNRAYTDHAFLEFERETVFAPAWVCIGTGASIPAPGDVQPVSWLGAPLVLVRTADGRINVFHNVCRHRGNELVWTAGNAGGAIRCPYHSWTYGLDGDLRATPHVGGPGVHHLDSIDPATCGLAPARSAVWLDQVFVNVSGDAPPFDEFIAPLQARIDTLAGRHWFEEMHADTELGTLPVEFGGNWKLCVENNLEAYHLPWVHPTLNELSPLDQHEMFFGDGFAGQITHGYDHEPITGGAFSVIDEWDGKKAEYPTLYPNLFLGIQCDHFWSRRVEPIAPDLTLDVLQIYYFDEAALADDLADVRAQRTEAWKEVFVEDLSVVEGMQRGRRSPAFSGGRFSEVMDLTSHHFARWAARRLVSNG